MDLTGKTALVCGSTQGIGNAAAHALASRGANVVLLARNKEKLVEVLATLDTSHGQVHSFLVADFAHPHELEGVIGQFAAANKVHILVNNTGGPPPGKIVDAGIEDFRIAFNTHLVCNHILVKALLDGMKSLGYGRIINVISTSVKQPLPGLGVSNTIRAAVANWAKTLAGEVGQYNITVNNVLPGATETGRLESIMATKAEKSGKSLPDIKSEMVAEIPMRRLGEPGEIAAAIAFLASPEAAYINGINLPVDGGRTGNL